MQLYYLLRFLQHLLHYHLPGLHALTLGLLLLLLVLGAKDVFDASTELPSQGLAVILQTLAILMSRWREQLLKRFLSLNVSKVWFPWSTWWF